MTLWKLVVELGHTAIMLPLAGAITAWLVTAGAWRMAACWAAMFAAGLGVVALSKIAFLGWQFGIPALEFKALSGHAYRATAVMPVLFFVVLHGAAGYWRIGGVALGIGISAVLAALLVHFKFHSDSEVIASFVLGMRVCLGYMRIARTLPPPQLKRWAVPVSVLVFAVIFNLRPSAYSYRLVDVALYFSGRDQPYQWSDKLTCDLRRP